ncbi:hypothetical protein ACQ4PT_067691 [Festuca glaucescens]
MAETVVVSKARSMLRGAISKAASAAAAAKLSLVMGVQKDVWFIQDDLKTMQAFLTAAEATNHRDMLLKIEMLKDMIMQLLGVESLKKCLKEIEGKVMQVKHLVEYLRKELKDKRYFIVLDDLWTLDKAYSRKMDC